MLKDKKQLPNSCIELAITGTASEFQQQFQRELEELAKTTKVTGFRPGKAPAAKVLAQLGRGRVEGGALDRLVSALYFETIQKEEIIPVGQPNVAVTEYKMPEGSGDELVVTFTATVDVMPKVEVKGYDKITLKKTKAEPITEDDITKVTDYLRKQRSLLEEAAPETSVQVEMWANIAFKGSVEGVARPDMQSNHHPLIVGEGQLIPGFEEQMIGMKMGEQKTFTITFPADYHAKELAGKEAEFTVTLNELKKVVMPELDAAFVAQFGHETLEQLLAAIKESLIEERAQELKRAQEEEVLDQLVALAKFELPQSLVEQELERVFVDAQKRLNQVPGQWERYLEQTGKTPDELKQEALPQAERNVRTGLILGQLIREEGITDSDRAGQQVLDKILERSKA